jgi:iron complex transport system substrate-binding protein
MSAPLRIVSTLPSATETVYQLGLEDSLFGVSHECNYPSPAAHKPRVTSVNFDYGSSSSAEIDAHVTTSLHNHESLYVLDEALLEQIQPTHLLTQQLCEVCAITPTEVQAALSRLDSAPDIVSVAPKSLADILADIETIGSALGATPPAQALTARLRRTMSDIHSRTQSLPSKSVFCVEWLDPLYASGHWVPEMIDIAGGRELLGSRGTTARKLSWESVASADPEFIILIPCGFSFEKIRSELSLLEQMPLWGSLKAARSGNVWIADGPSHFNQSGPRVISEGIPLLAQILHPNVFGQPNQAQAVKAQP